MAISTDKLAPRIIVNEHNIKPSENKELNSPVTMLFGFSPIGKTCEMVVCNNVQDIYNEFGFPQTSAEKYFFDAALRIVQEGSTAIMNRLPYDNDQSHKVKFVDYKLNKPIEFRQIASGPSEEQTRRRDDIGVTVLKKLHNLDATINQIQRISQKEDNNGNSIGSMTNEELIELELDPKYNLPEDTFRIVDIRSEQYGIGVDKNEYTGIFPVIVSAPMALYFQEKIQNTKELDECFQMIDLSNGIEVNAPWYNTNSQLDDNFKTYQRNIISSIDIQVNFNTNQNKFHRSYSLQDNCLSSFPLINKITPTKIDKKTLSNIGILVCRLVWDEDKGTTNIQILETYIGDIGYGRNGIDRKINKSSKYIRMYKNVTIPPETDCFIIDHQRITSLGMSYNECLKNINYKTSIVDPISFMLESVYSDIDSLQVDVILDSGLSSIAFAAYTAKDLNGNTFFEDNEISTNINWAQTNYDINETIEKYAFVWSQITKMFGNFCKNVRGDCVYIADGPRILNLERNYPIRNFSPIQNIELFNKYLPLFNGINNNYIARYFNWVYIGDMQYENMGFWVPGSVVVGSQLASNDRNGQIWYAPAGQNRGIINEAFDVSVKTKQYNKENDILYSNNWNFFNTYQNQGVIIDGQKTMQTNKTSLDRLNVRRMVCYIKQQVRKIGNKYKYEPHTLAVRESFKTDIDQLLRQIQRTDGISDYRIICDNTNNTIETVDRHELWCKIAIKPVKAIEYIIIDLNIINGNVNINE